MTRALPRRPSPAAPGAGLAACPVPGAVASLSPSLSPRPAPGRPPRRAGLLRGGLALLLVALAPAGAWLPAAQAASRAPVAAANGMVVTAQHLASTVGVQVLKDGGNAVDAAVAVGYALAVVYPAAGNLGGGGFMTVQMAPGADGKPGLQTFFDFRETAPGAARPDMYLDAQGNPIKGKSTQGHLAVAVPGTVHGLETVREKLGTMSRAALIEPAIRLAEDGFVLDEGDVAMLATGTAAFQADAPSAAIFLNAAKAGAPWQPGDRLVQADLARTLKAIRDRGTAGFYAGPVAQALATASQAGGGIITTADLAAYRTRELKPVACSYRGWQVVSAPPPSSGGVILCEMLHILEGYPLADWGFHSAASLHVQIEAMRHAYLDRNTYLGDPDFVRNPLERLLSKDYAAQIRAAIDLNKAGDSRALRPGVAPHPPVNISQEGSNTTHYSIVDRWGNAVAVTYTLNDWFGAKVTAAGTGVLLNNEMDDFTIKPGVPNIYGLVQGQANAIAPGKRPLSSMSPTIVHRDGRPVMVLGTPGGSRIITAVLQTMLHAIDHGMTVQEAVDAPRFHQQWLPEATTLEPYTLSADTQRLLEAKGHRFSGAHPPNHLAAIIVGAPSLGGQPVPGKRFFGAIDPRRGTGSVAGY